MEEKMDDAEEKESFVHLPFYEGMKSRKILEKGDFKENYLLYISCFCMEKHLNIIEKRIKENFKKNIYIDDSFCMLDEICGRDKKILKIGTLLDMFSAIDYKKYQKEIIHTFYLQFNTVKFNKKNKYPIEYKLYNEFQKRYLNLEKDELKEYKIEEDSLTYMFLKALIYTNAMSISEQIFRIDNFMSLLDKDDILYIAKESDIAAKELKKLVDKYKV